MKKHTILPAVVVAAACAGAEIIPVPPLPPPSIRVPDLRADEKSVDIASSRESLADNGFFRLVRTTFTFTNPNARQMSADFEFPLPPEATVCGYALEIDGAMIPGVVVGKEAARVAFETEKARNVDPGIVEHVAGNIWRTRIFPLLPNKPRKVQVDYIEPSACCDSPREVWEKDGAEIFVARIDGQNRPGMEIPGAIASFKSGAIVWDASASAEKHSSEWLKRLENLPDAGEWRLILLRNEPEDGGAYKEKPALLAALAATVYDGGTDIGAAVAAAGSSPVLLFTDELDTLGVTPPRYEEARNVVIASRPEASACAIAVEKLKDGETPPEGVEVKESKLLATAWAAKRIKDLSSQADARREEFLALGRRYGVASPVTSLIVLENLAQYKEHKIEPHPSLSFHDEWVRWRDAQDDEIARKEADAEHVRDLLKLWKERVEWWNNPVPPRAKPKSGLFDTLVEAFTPSEAIGPSSGRAALRMSAARAPDDGYAEESGAVNMEASVAAAAPAPASEKASAGNRTAAPGAASIVVMPWKADAPYLKTLAKASDIYAEYLALRKEYGSAPAFYMDVASFFFAKGEKTLAKRILSNMAEFKLESAAIWRSMGWRLSEAGELLAAAKCFRKALALRGEEGQSRRDLALILAEYGKETSSVAAIEEAMALLKEAAFTNFARRSGRRSNDRQVSILALEELNALISWCEAKGVEVAVPQFDSAFRRDLPVKIRIVLSWDADETDLDLHVLEPDGEEAFYGNRRTSSGGFVSEDVTTGYGPEEYLRKEGTGRFKVLAHYYASHQTALTGAATATATVFTDWGTDKEQMKKLTLRLEKPHSKHLIGEVKVE